MQYDDDGNAYVVNPVKILLRIGRQFIIDCIAEDAMDGVRRARAITAYPSEFVLLCGQAINNAAGRTDIEKITNAWRSQRKLVKVPVIDDEWA